MALPSKNAAQLKYVISKLRFFIGARMHAIIAAMSSSVPTISISFSVKTRGINRGLFRHEDLVLPTNMVSMTSVLEKLEYLLENEESIRGGFAKSVPSWHRELGRMSKDVLDGVSP